jgi:hypothetical protein
VGLVSDQGYRFGSATSRRTVEHVVEALIAEV